ncbi:hypothetical protein CS006_10215 [Bifidobacterium primatium]|uniref:Tetrapyrrole biosynthesis uroporphyrinogen III synthase domain-containing protein n=1 Tax=Bifidobacterium primatium TaxID=2045438 RepID=A0A2M9H6P3_9BIFI|nr:uroporphyrinogen-III synthase [Bifidobacterium primatium]PJM72489.1 hypothetical protein CS006_10215 [Bifidobacterium primatium]
MTVLITYPQDHIDEALRRRLDDAARPAGGVVYCPLRKLHATVPNESDLRTIASSDYLIITSNFALALYLEHYRHLNWLATVVVLSRKMATQAERYGLPHVLTPDEENQRGLARLLVTLPRARMAMLGGDLRVPHDHIPEEIPRIRIYENMWNDELEQSAVATIAAGAGADRPIDRILVTSPSSYRRLRAIIEKKPDSFAPTPTYYALGPSTADIIREDGGSVIVPESNDVLRRAIELIMR